MIAHSKITANNHGKIIVPLWQSRSFTTKDKHMYYVYIYTYFFLFAEVIYTIYYCLNPPPQGIWSTVDVPTSSDKHWRLVARIDFIPAEVPKKNLCVLVGWIFLPTSSIPRSDLPSLWWPQVSTRHREAPQNCGPCRVGVEHQNGSNWGSTSLGIPFQILSCSLGRLKHKWLVYGITMMVVMRGFLWFSDLELTADASSEETNT